MLAHQLKSGAAEGAFLQSAGMLGGAGQPLCPALAGFGTAIGTVYQICDDVADLQGVACAGKATKRVGEDLINGKVTMPLAHAVTRVPTDVMRQWWAAVREGRPDTALIGEMAGQLEACTDQAEALLGDAWATLEPPASRSPRYPPQPPDALPSGLAWAGTGQHLSGRGPRLRGHAQTRAGSGGAGSRRSDRHRGVPHRKAAPHRVDSGPDARQHILQLGRRELAVVAMSRQLVQPLVPSVGPLPVESPLLRIAERAHLSYPVGPPGEQPAVGLDEACARVRKDAL